MLKMLFGRKSSIANKPKYGVDLALEEEELLKKAIQQRRDSRKSSRDLKLIYYKVVVHEYRRAYKSALKSFMEAPLFEIELDAVQMKYRVMKKAFFHFRQSMYDFDTHQQFTKETIFEARAKYRTLAQQAFGGVKRDELSVKGVTRWKTKEEAKRCIITMVERNTGKVPATKENEIEKNELEDSMQHIGRIFGNEYF